MISYNSSIVTDGLVLCLDAANPRSYPLSGNSVSDLSGNNVTNTLTNGVSFDSNNSGFFTFDGTNDYITTSAGSPFYEYGTELSASFWIKRNGDLTFGSGGGQSTANTDNGIYTVWLFHAVSENRFSFYVRGNDNGSYYWRSTTCLTLADNTWYFVCGTCSASNIKIYINAEQHGSATGIDAGSIVNNSNSVVQYGKDPRYSSNRFFKGSIGPCLIYNRALSADEVRRNYNATRGRYGN